MWFFERGVPECPTGVLMSHIHCQGARETLQTGRAEKNTSDNLPANQVTGSDGRANNRPVEERKGQRREEERRK